jgi:hypothetical protein
VTRHEKYARALLDAPNPVFAIAHALAEQDARIDAVAARVLALTVAARERKGTL